MLKDADADRLTRPWLPEMDIEAVVAQDEFEKSRQKRKNPKNVVTALLSCEWMFSRKKEVGHANDFSMGLSPSGVGLDIPRLALPLR